MARRLWIIESRSRAHQGTALSLDTAFGIVPTAKRGVPFKSPLAQRVYKEAYHLRVAYPHEPPRRLISMALTRLNKQHNDIPGEDHQLLFMALDADMNYPVSGSTTVGPMRRGSKLTPLKRVG